MAIQFLNTVDLNFNQLNKAAIQNIPTTDPVIGVLGQLIYNVSESAIKVCTTASSIGPTVNAVFTEVGSGGDITAVQASDAIDQLGIKLTDSAGPIPKVGLDIIGQTNLGAAPNVADELIIYDLSTTTNKSITVANLLSGVLTDITAGDGLVETGDASTPTISVDYSATSSNIIQEAAIVTSISDPTYTPFIMLSESNPGTPNGAVSKIRIENIRLDQLGNPDNNIAMDTNLITGMGDPLNAQDAATKKYVDDLIAGGLTFKGTFNAATGAIVGGSTFLYQLVDAGTDFAPAKPRVAVAPGDYYVAATAGQFYGSGGTGGGGAQLDIGDAIIGLTAAVADASVVTNWSTISQGVTVNSITSNDTSTSTGDAITTNAAATGAVTVNAFKYAGTTNVGYVPSGGTSTTFLRGDGTFATPINTGALGKSVPLDGEDDGVARTTGSGITTFAITVNDTAIFGAIGSNKAPLVKCEVTADTGGQTVYADVTRAGDVLSIVFTGTIDNADYNALLTYVG